MLRSAVILRRGLQLTLARISSKCFIKEPPLVSPLAKTPFKIHHCLLSTEKVSACRSLSSVGKKENHLNVSFDNNENAKLSYIWLRDNCQCAECFDGAALQRTLLTSQLKLDVHPNTAKINEDGCLEVQWNDGHSSQYNADWIHQRSVKLSQRSNLNKLPHEPWGKNHEITKFDYSSLMKNDEELLRYITSLEKYGAVFVGNCPHNDKAGQDLVNHIAFSKRTHYGIHAPVFARADNNNVAYSSKQLGLHVDLPYYEYMPGLIYLHMVIQSKGGGGETEVSDAHFAAEYLKINHPESYKTLTTTEVYFYDEGVGQVKLESSEFRKILKRPIIELDIKGNFKSCGFNNHVRDSYLDLPVDEMPKFYEAYKLFHDVLYDNVLEIRLQDGEMVVLDNTRCLHGRKGYLSNSDRYLDNIYMDWDEVLCKRRSLQYKLQKIH